MRWNNFYISIFLFFFQVCGSLPIDAQQKDTPPAVSQNELSPIEYLSTILPSDSFKIIDWSDELSDVLVINIQDYHAHYETQKRYPELLELFSQHNDALDIPFVGVEGASGVIDTAYASAYPTKKINNIVADQFFKSGIISGVEYYSITSDNPFPLIGIDSPPLYRKNSEFYSRLQHDLLSSKQDALNVLRVTREQCRTVAGIRLEEPSAQLFNQYYLLQNSEIEYIAFARYLLARANEHAIDTAEYKSLVNSVVLIDRESALDKKQLKDETFSLFMQLISIVPVEDVEILQKAHIQFSFGKLSVDTFFDLLSRYQSDYGISLDDKPSLRDMQHILTQFKQIRESDLHKEMDLLFADVLAYQNISEEEKALFESVKMIFIMGKMLHLSATKEEFEEYRLQRDKYSLETVISLLDNLADPIPVFSFSTNDYQNVSDLLRMAEGFYEEALSRDRYMLDTALNLNNTFHGESIVLVTGGFHSQGFAEFCQERKLSYVIVRPVLQENNFETAYQSLLLNGLDPFSQMLSGLGTQLMLPSWFKNLLNPDHEAVLLAKWFIFSLIADGVESLDGSQLARNELEALFHERQQQFLVNLAEKLLEQFDPLMKQGILPQGYVNAQLAKVDAVLNQIDFDFTDLEYYPGSLAVPVVLKKDANLKVVIRARRIEAADTPQNVYAQLTDSIITGDYVLDVFSENPLANHQKVQALLRNTSGEEFPALAQEKFFDIVNLFGISTGELLLAKYSVSDLIPLLLEGPAYSDIENLRDLAPTTQVAIDLLLFDFEGFLNLTYQISQNDDDEESTEYIIQLAEAAARMSSISNAQAQLPNFVIEPATFGDLSRWYNEPMPRSFTREEWEDAIEVSNHLYFLKARDPQGTILGLMTTSSMPDINVVYINFLEVSANARGIGIGRDLIKDLIGRNPTAIILLDTDDANAIAFYERLGFNTLSVEKESKFSLLPLKAGSIYMELKPEAAQELLGLSQTQPEDSAINASDVELIMQQITPIGQAQAIEHFGAVMVKYGKLSNDEKMFIISKMVTYLNLTIEQAIQLLDRISLEPSNFYNTLQGIYDSMVDEYIAGFGSEQDIALAVVQLNYGEIPVTLPFIDGGLSFPMFNRYQDIHSRLQQSRAVLGDRLYSRFDTDYSFNGTVSQSAPLLSNVRKILQQHGLFYDIQVLPPDDPRIAEKAMALIDNIVYVSETIHVSDFVFYLSHEMSHLLDGESSARQRDMENIQFMLQTADYLLDAIRYTDDLERQRYLGILANQLRYRAYQYEFNIITAQLQNTQEGRAYLEENRLPRITGVSDEYLRAISTINLSALHTFPGQNSMMMQAAQELGEQVQRLAADDQLDITVFVRNLKRKVVGTVLRASITAAQVRPDQIDAMLSEWVASQRERIFWQTDDESIPPLVAEFIERSTAELGYVDIRNIQRSIARTLRQSEDNEYKAALEKQVSQWVQSLLRENISPAEGITQLPDIIQQKCANCLGFSKLFDAISTQFGLSVSKTVMDFTVDRRKELHAANLVRFSDGTTELVEVVDSAHLYVSGQKVQFNGIVVRKSRDDQWNYELMSLDDLSVSEQNSFKGLARKTVDAFSYMMRAVALMEQGTTEQAMAFMLKAYMLNPDVPYIAFNTAQLAFIHWLENQPQDIPQNEVIEKMKSLYEEYRLFQFAGVSWQYFYESLDSFEQGFMLVNSISSIGGGGDGRIPPYRKKVQPVNPVEKLPKKLPKKEPDYTSKEPPEEPPEEEEVETPPQQKTVADRPATPSLWTSLELMAVRNQASLNIQQRANPALGFQMYRMNQLAGNVPGLALSTAAQMIKTGSQIETFIHQQNYARAQQMLMGLDPHFAERVMKEFPWILVFMLELYPEWWRGRDLRKIAEDAQLDAEREEQMRLQLTSVQAVPSTQDKDPFRRPQGQNPLWSIVSAQNTRSVLDTLSEREDITSGQYRAMYEITASDTTFISAVSDSHREALFGKRDELPAYQELRIQDGYLLGAGFETVPAGSDSQLYASFLTTIFDEHPEEVMALLYSLGDRAVVERLSNSFGISAKAALRSSRGALSIVGDELFQAVDDFDLVDGVRTAIQENDLFPVLEAVFSSNLIRDELQDTVTSIYELNILDAQERAVLEYLNKYYVDGDERTAQFNNAVELMADIIAEYPFIGEKIVVLATRLKRLDPGKLLYALLVTQSAERSTIGTSPKPALPVKLTTVNPLLDQAM